MLPKLRERNQTRLIKSKTSSEESILAEKIKAEASDQKKLEQLNKENIKRE